MKRIMALLMLSCLLLTGCNSWLDGSYSDNEPGYVPMPAATPKKSKAYNKRPEMFGEHLGA